MKRIFHIKEDISNFFLQDSEGRIVILPKILPEELSVFLYVRPNETSDNQNKINNNNQINNNDSSDHADNSDKWIFKCTKGTEEQLINGVRYCHPSKPLPKSLEIHPCVKSSIEFSKGKHFCVIKLDSHGCGIVGLG